MSRRVPALVLALALMGPASGCSGIKDHRGFVVDEEAIAAITPGVDTKNSVLERLGSPSSLATFDANAWYYISTKEEHKAFFDPKVEERTVLVVKFNPDQTVASLERYGAEDARRIDYVDRRTPTRGKELTFLEQMFGNIGKVSKSGAGEAE